MRQMKDLNNYMMKNQKIIFHEDKKFDYEYVGTVVNAGNEVADVYVWVLFDRQKQLYITEFEIESIQRN